MNSLEEHPEDAEPAGSSLADDTLSGAQAIADFLGENRRQVFYKCEKGLIPAGKLGKIWMASKRKLKAHYSNVTSGGGK